MLNSHVCTKCTLGQVALEKTEIDLHAFKQQALSTAINLKRPKVTGWEVGVSSDTIRLGLKQSSLGGTFYPNVSKNHKIQLIFTESNNKLIQLLEYWRRSRLERVPALTVTLPVRWSLIIPDHERWALFCYPVISLGVQ